MNITPDVYSSKHNDINFSGRKIPRYLYHLTKESNVAKINEQGALLPSKADSAGERIFMFELGNLKEWARVVFDFNYANYKRFLGNPNNEEFFFHTKKLQKGGMTPEQIEAKYPSTLINALIGMTNSNTEKLCVLRIPTAKLDSSKLTIRDQVKTNNYFASQEFQKLVNNFIEHMKTMRDKVTPDTDFKTFFDTEFEKFVPQSAREFIFGDAATKSKLHKMRSEAIEYVYENPISSRDIELAGELLINNSTKQKFANEQYPFRALFENMFFSSGEQKAIQQLKL